MKTIYKNFKLTSTYIGDKPCEADSRIKNCNNHRITVTNTKTHKKISFEFWGSIIDPIIKEKQELLFAFYCFLSEGSSTLCGFEEFCFNFGYNNDSIKAYKIFKSCEKSLRKMEKIGIDKNEIYVLMNDLQENHDC